MSTRDRDDGAEAITERQAAVLRAVVTSYVGGGNPVGSQMIAHLLPVPLSSASVRNTLAQLTALGLVAKPHRSSGRMPTEAGLRVFVDSLCSPADLPRSEQRDIDYRFEAAEGDAIVTAASGLLSRHTRQLGFVSAPRVDRVVLRHVSLVRVAHDRLLVVLVSDTGVLRRTIDADPDLDQPGLDRMATLLSERVAGRTLSEVRERLDREARRLQREANAVLSRAIELGRRVIDAQDNEPTELIIETRLTLLDQPEFSDPRRVRDLFEALETKTGLLEVLDEVLAADGVSVAIGDEIDDPALRRCALVASQYGGGEGREPLGVLGVIGPSRMDFARVIPLVDYLSHSVTGRLNA